MTDSANGAYDAMLTTIRTQLRTLVDSDTFDLPTVDLIANLASVAIDVLHKLRAKTTDGMLNPFGMSGAPALGSPPLPSYSSVVSSGYPLVSSMNPSETFGAKIIREITSALPEFIRMQRDTPSALISAIAEARKEGLFDVSAALEKRLLGSAAPVPAAPLPLSTDAASDDDDRTNGGPPHPIGGSTAAAEGATS